MDKEENKEASVSISNNDTDTNGLDDDDYDEDDGKHTMMLGPQVPLKDHLELDKDDDSLRRWKEQLLGDVDTTKLGETAEPEVTILNLTILTPERPDLVLAIPLVLDDKGYAFALKDGSTYSFRFSFTVSNNIVSGLRYTHTVWKTGVRGREVKPGTTVKCEPGHGFILHLSQAALGESKKSDSALMYVKVDDQKLAIGTLSIDKYPQIQCDLVFDKEFELSHTSKTTSVFFTGYKVEQPTKEDEMDLDSEDEEEEELNIPVIKENGKADGKEEQKNQEKAVAAASKSSLASRLVEKKSKDDDDLDEDETDDSDEHETDDSDEGEGLSPEEGDDDDSSDEDDTSEDEEETPTPKKPEAGKKRAAENALKTLLSDKKAKVATPSAQKTGGKKGATHVANPYPAKQAGMTLAKNDKSKEKSPRSGGSVPCKSCSKTFNSEMALQAHSKAKHRAK